MRRQDVLTSNPHEKELVETMMTSGMYTSKTPEWFTPQPFFDELDREFNFTLDPCATKENAKCKKFYTAEQDGLAQDWTGERVFCNPPYGRQIGRWVEKLATGGGRTSGRSTSLAYRHKMVPRFHSS